MDKKPGHQRGAKHGSGQTENAGGAAGRGHGGARPKVRAAPNRARSSQRENGDKPNGGFGRGANAGAGGEGWRGAGSGGGRGTAGAERNHEGGRRDRGRGGRGRGGGRSQSVAGGERGGGEFGANGNGRWRNQGRENGDRRGGNNSGARSGNRQEMRDNTGERKNGPMGYKKLEELSEKEPSEVAVIVSSHPALKPLLSEPTMRKDMVELLCLVLNKAFKSRADRSTLQHLAGTIKDSSFLRTVLPHFLVGVCSESDDARREKYPEDLANILVVLTQVLSTFPASSVQPVGLLLTLLPGAVNSLRTSGVDVPAQIEENMEHLQHVVSHLQTKSREGTLRSDKDTSLIALPPTAENIEEDQQDFRTIPIYPTPEELQHGNRPYLRPNLTSQRYPNTHVYLDTHFRLLREDFVRPLREGIQELLFTIMNTGRMDNVGNQGKAKRLDDIRVYHDTKVIAPKCTMNGLAYVIQFNVDQLKFVRWQNSKRLIFGSLVCLSCDNFESFLFATVSDRDPKDLQEGKVQITFTEESRNTLARIEQNQVYLMVETTAYFEAYRYVLEGLQEQEEDELPFQRYLVDCSPDVEPPAYLQRADTYDLSSVAHPDFKSEVKPFHCLDAKAWPTMEKLGLDESQFDAFKLALTKELVIIQGPPGTGKTYVGLKIAHALLTNQSLWRVNTPILVVCYTNHALDQFLEGIHKFLPDGIVRVGGRSNSEILKQFNLRELAHKEKFKRNGSNQLSAAYNTIYREVREAERGLEVQSVQLECSVRGVLQENFLQRYISKNHWDSLHAVYNQDGFERVPGRKLNLIMEWLGLGGLSHGNAVYTPMFNDTEAEAAAEVLEDVFINIVEEADMMAAERFIDDSIYPRGGKHEHKERDTEQVLREVEGLMLAISLDEPEAQAEENPGMSDNAWELQKNQKKNLKRKIKNELQKSSTFCETREGLITNVWTLTAPDRWRLYRLWLSRYRTEMRIKALDLEQEYQNSVNRLAEVKRQQDCRILREATVIGMTTTGAAKFRRVLQQVRPALVIVEEAAEVLEAHTITSLSRACQHLILIGDHQQLRPSATVYDLAKNFNLELSMFERLVNMKLPFVRLNYQHRMRPDIARLLTPHIYSELENHPSVLEYDNIKGLNTNLFFVEHTHPEEEIKDGRSHQNRHEAQFVVALCQYLLLQEYKPEQITILTTYTGQLLCLRNLMPASRFSGVKVHVVDKYQGEENDIVLLSLVRSNKQRKVGFLNIPNRVCVALSRAKKGLYCIGNSEMLGQVKLWSNIFHTLREKDQIGTGLTLCCQNHPSRQVQACNATDFGQAPEGGCTQPCEYRLDCGHVCAKVCHTYDPEHKKYQCLKKCQKVFCDLGHRCLRLCYQTCGDCNVMLEKTIPRCQHKQMVPCHKDPNSFVCQEPCQKTLDCEHPCDSVCGAPCTTNCKVKINFDLKCGHNKMDFCHFKTQNEPYCTTPCKQELKCGHACRGKCSLCHEGRYHRACSQKCERILVCSHKCQAPCTNCPPCARPCENCCVHSQCSRLCGQPCSRCVEPCAWQCPHQTCTKLCHEPCDRPPCDEPCDKALPCGHPCIGLCGEKCPGKCRVCDREEVTEIFFGFEQEEDALFIQLQDCGHIIERRAMDQYMEMDERQQENEEQVAIKLKECPKCRTPIRKNLRYGSHINRCLAEIELVKQKIAGNQEDIQAKTLALRKLWRENKHKAEFNYEFDKIKDQLKSPHLSSADLWVVENKMDFFTRVAKLLVMERENMSSSEGELFKERIQEFVGLLQAPQQRFTEQQVFDLERELRRLTLLAKLNAHSKMALNRGQRGNIQMEEQTLRDILAKCGPFTEGDEAGVKQILELLKKKFPLTGLGISDEERKMIVSAIQLPGHWFKCPNGHVYLISDCGGATESRKCPDCNAVIGGASHRVTSGNQLASEMDGAQRPAWPSALGPQL
ncbi:NFX1-type zinc finger-containing protein 1-like [Eucyclogobius newberryi]|uniref:NFX1-type zinc finger-containing protein 1-like n=1 Tax=Eucyclogobius newberryi TaxID=166745 RepID=UPI003B5CB6F7